MGPIYTKVSITTYATCAVDQFTEEEEEKEDGQNRSLAVFCV